MKTILKLFLVLALCFAALCQSQNDFSLLVDAISVSVSENLVPFFKVKENDNIYYLRLQSIYEIQQQNDSMWYRIPGTETPFSALNWNMSTSLSDGTFTLFGYPCPCEDAPPQQEPTLGKRIVRGSPRRNSNCNGNGDGDGTTPPGNQGTDNGTDTGNNNNNICPPVNFEYVRLFFQLDKNCSSGNGGNGGNNTIDADQCNTTCVSACDSAANVTSCVAYCSSFYNVTYLDEAICNSTCIVDDVADADCLAACNSWSTCLNGSSNTIDADQCNTTCVSACDSAVNVTSCMAFCNSFYNVTYIDEAICNSTCIVDDVAEPNCLTACNSWSTCFSNNTGNSSTPEEPAACDLTLNYLLYKYTFSNITTNSSNGGSDQPNSVNSNVRLAFAFEVIQQPENVPCRSFFDNWYEGPFNIKLNVSTLALENYPDDDSNLDISNATQVESNLVYAVRDDIIVGRIYVEQFPDGYSIFNAKDSAVSTPPANNDTTTAKRSIPYNYNLESVQPPLFQKLRKSSKN